MLVCFVLWDSISVTFETSRSSITASIHKDRDLHRRVYGGLIVRSLKALVEEPRKRMFNRKTIKGGLKKFTADLYDRTSCSCSRAVFVAGFECRYNICHCLNHKTRSTRLNYVITAALSLPVHHLGLREGAGHGLFVSRSHYQKPLQDVPALLQRNNPRVMCMLIRIGQACGWQQDDQMSLAAITKRMST